MSNPQINYDNEEIVPVGTSSASEHETYNKAEQFAKQSGKALIKYSSSEFFQLVLEIDYLYQVYESEYFKMMNEIRGIALKDAEEARDQERKERLEAIEDRKRAEADRKRAAEVADENRAIAKRLEERVNVLTANNNKLVDTVDDMSDRINGLTSTVEEIRQELADQKILSTMLPISRNLDHYVAVVMLETERDWSVQIIAMQKLSFDKKLADFVHEDIKILSAKTFIANGINFRNNVLTYNTAAFKSICRRENVSLSKLKRDGLKLGKMKTVIPKECPFTLELFMASFEDVLTDTQVKKKFASLKKN